MNSRAEQRKLMKFLLVGSERSGSTMLRLMLDHHSELSCMHKSDFMPGNYEKYRRRSWDDVAHSLQDDWHFAHSGLVFPREAMTYHELIEEWFQQRSRTSGKTIVGATVQHCFHHLPVLFSEANYVH